MSQALAEESKADLGRSMIELVVEGFERDEQRAGVLGNDEAGSGAFPGQGKAVEKEVDNRTEGEQAVVAAAAMLVIGILEMSAVENPSHQRQGCLREGQPRQYSSIKVAIHGSTRLRKKKGTIPP